MIIIIIIIYFGANGDLKIHVQNSEGWNHQNSHIGRVLSTVVIFPAGLPQQFFVLENAMIVAVFSDTYQKYSAMFLYESLWVCGWLVWLNMI